MPLRVYDHGSCCGANVIDGFHSRESKVATYMRSDNFTHEQAEEALRTSSYPTLAKILEELVELLRDNKGHRGQFMVILNDTQNEVTGEHLQKLFNFQLLFSDVSNPNHSSDKKSRLWTYIWVSRPYMGNREEVGLDKDYKDLSGRIPELSEIPGYAPPPPPPPVWQIPHTATTNYGVRIAAAA